jgi:hypothetical protein
MLDLLNYGESRRRRGGKRQGIAGKPESPDLVCCTIAHKEDDHGLFGNDGGAGV